MANVRKLREKMYGANIGMGKMADIIGVDRSTFYRKMNDYGEDFSLRQAKAIAENLKLSALEAAEIFFT